MANSTVLLNFPKNLNKKSESSSNFTRTISRHFELELTLKWQIFNTDVILNLF